MKEIGSQIKKIRNEKGLSQENLAENAKVNLRTIQRIENNESEPRGKTLKLICQALDINDLDIINKKIEIERNYIFYLNLSILSGLLVPLGNLILPLTLWLNNKNKIKGISEIGKNILNFQLIWTIGILMLILGLAKLGFPPHTILYIFIMSVIINLTFVIINLINLKNGKIDFRYPKLFNIIK